MGHDVDNEEAFLRLHGWTSPNGDGLWAHPLDAAARRLNRHSTRDAADIQRLNNRILVLVEEGWNVDTGTEARTGYYRTVLRMRSPKDFLGRANRTFVTADHAIRHQQAIGWTKAFATPQRLPSYACRYDVFTWCNYCDEWHAHHVDHAGVGVGSDVGVASHPFDGTKHPYSEGYEPDILFVDETPAFDRRKSDGRAMHRALLEQIAAIPFSREGLTVRDILKTVFTPPFELGRYDALRTILAKLGRAKPESIPNPIVIGKYFRSIASLHFGDYSLERARVDSTNTIRWRVVRHAPMRVE